MGQLNVVKYEVVSDSLPLKDPTEAQIVEAVCNAISLGDGLDTVFDIEAERTGKPAFMYVTDFITTVKNNTNYSKMYDDAMNKRHKLTQEAVHSAMKRYNANPTSKNLEIFKLHTTAAKVAAETIKTSVVIENNQIFPPQFFTGIPNAEILPTDTPEEKEKKERINKYAMDVLVTPDEIRKTPEYKERIKRVANLDPNDAAFWTHQVGGIFSSEAKRKRDLRIKEDSQSDTIRSD